MGGDRERLVINRGLIKKGTIFNTARVRLLMLGKGELYIVKGFKKNWSK